MQKGLPDRFRRVLWLGGTGLALTLIALGTAAWSLVRAEHERNRTRTEDRAEAFAERLLGAAARVTAGRDDVEWIVLDGEFRVIDPPPPRAFASLPPVADVQGAFFVAEIAAAEPAQADAALGLALASEDPVVRLQAALAGARGGRDAASMWRAADVPAALLHSRDAVLLGLLAGDTDARFAALRAVGGADEDAASALLFGTLADEAVAAEMIRRRRDALSLARELSALVRVAPRISESDAARVLVEAGGAMVVGLPAAPVGAAGPEGAAWWTTRAGPGSFERATALVKSGAERTVPARDLRGNLVGGGSGTVSRMLPGAGGYAVLAEPESAWTSSLLLIGGFSVACLAAVAAFVAFGRGVVREARLARMRAEFVATVGHELRTPVAVIRSAAEALQLGRATRDEDRVRLVQGIVRESERLSGLLGNVLDFARMEAGRRRFAFADCDVAALVRETVEAHGAALDRAQVTVRVDVPDHPLVVRGDRDALGAALVNLLDNAAKFAGDGSVVTVLAELRGGDVLISVADRGPGIPDAEKERVFERFVRGSAPSVQETRGTGIGLALVRHAARAHGGRADVIDSVDGSGATFRLWLPHEPAGDDEGKGE